MKTNIRKFKVNKEQLAVIISEITGDRNYHDSKRFRKLQRQTKEVLFIRVETLLKSYKKYTRRLKIAFDIARVKLPARI